MENNEVLLKTCTRCGKTKPLEDFVKDNRRKDGRGSICYECKRIKDKEYYEKKKNDPEFHQKMLERGRKYKEEHREEIREKAKEYNSRPEVIERRANWHQNKQSKRSIPTKIQDMVTRAKNRAIEKGVPFKLTREDIEFVEICPLLGIPLNWEGGPRDKNTPSLDRIIPEKGYIKGNVRIISNLANMMKSYANNSELETFAKNIHGYMKSNKEEDIVQTIENKESIELQDKEPVG